MSKITEDLTAILTSRYGVPAARIETGGTLNELGIDSLVTVELTLTLQKALGVPLAPDEITSAHTVAEIVELIESKGAAVK
ncbi:acyl carrier protein [Kitasatospora sp. NPDC058032]|uniref:acyl carrier protein n=1 Tax=unclassified Kitasatospora TaxID=2633591 RepID=UPI0033A5685C